MRLLCVQVRSWLVVVGNVSAVRSASGLLVVAWSDAFCCLGSLYVYHIVEGARVQ